MATYNKVIFAALCVLAISTFCQAHPQYFGAAGSENVNAQPGVQAAQYGLSQAQGAAQPGNYQGSEYVNAGPGGASSGFNFSG